MRGDGTARRRGGVRPAPAPAGQRPLDVEEALDAYVGVIAVLDHERLDEDERVWWEGERIWLWGVLGAMTGV